MPREPQPVGPKEPTGATECREGPPGEFYIWEEFRQEYQNYDDMGHPIGDPYVVYTWDNTLEPCAP